MSKLTSNKAIKYGVQSLIILCFNSVGLRYTAASIDLMQLGFIFVSSTTRLFFIQFLNRFISRARIVSKPSDCSILILIARLLRLCLKSGIARAVTQVSDHILNSNNTRQPCNQLLDSGTNKIYIVKVAHLVF